MKALSRLATRASRPQSRRQRRRPGRYGPALLALLLTGCRVLSQEEQLLTDFFEASRLHDTTVVAKMSDATFNPRIDGVVDRFEVEEVERAEDGLSERVTIQALVRGTDGGVVSKRMLVTLRRQNGRRFVASLRDL
jgi:hypothetical protein